MMISALGSEKRNSIIKTALNDNGKPSLTYRLSDELMTPPIKSKSTTSCGQ
uniref:Uncharacterized protein n=1 Tax=Acrobeloides nanus TaxID=290746 RepID=A0A914CV26_9BILA